MRYAVISDIHGNLEALKAVLSDIELHEIDVIICLGDIVGYYPDPEMCVKLIQEHAAYSVAGNHDYAAINIISTDNFTYYAYEAMEWTKSKLSEESKKYLASLPLTIEMDKMFFTHASPANPEEYMYIFPNSEQAILQAFSSMVFKINFIGHAHWPFIMTQENLEIVSSITSEVDVQDDRYYLINVGSVGQPRNLDTNSSYAIYDTAEKLISLQNVPYDFTITQQKVMNNKLPAFLAERLASGR